MLQSGRHSKQFYADMWKTLGRGESWTGFFINRRKDGSLYEEEAVISPVCGGEGSVVGYVAIKRDVTREREMIRKLEKGHRLEAIGRLAGGIAHDFNNLLVAVLGSVELLQKRLPSGVEYQKDLGVIHGAAVRASQLTRQLLAFARHQVLKPVHMDLDRVLADMMPLIQRLIPETIEAAHRNEGPTAWVRADRTQVEQVILNLCVNSRDAMPDGGKLLLETRKVRLDGAYVSDHPWARQGDFVVLSVSDTGLGMNRETQDHIFEPFFTTKKDGRGTGLGLAAVYGIVQQHEGLIHAYSEPGEGTTFKVYLPAVAGPAAPERESIAAPARGGTEVILVVEDEPAVRDVVVDVLLSYGYRILEAENGAAAMEILEDADAEIDLVASDLVMPVMGGVELLKEARRIRPDLPFLFSSGYSESAVRHEFDDEPRVAFLAKPFGVDVLLRTIRRLLDRAGSPSNP
ncbi:MAG: ATP-binding protein [Acidobacteriota bacterium]